MINTEDRIFYSKNAIGLATFLGGPLAAGYLIRNNYNNLNEFEKGKNAFLFGLATCVLIFVVIFSIPDAVLDNIPNQLIPVIYTAITYYIVERIHGEELKKHKENGLSFYSGWRAAGIGFVSLVIMLVGIFGYLYLSTDHELYDKYDEEMKVFTSNEEESLKIYNELGQKSRVALINRIDDLIIPTWEENIDIINRTNSYVELPEELKSQNEVLMEYAELRISSFKLLKQAIQEDTDKYGIELDSIHNKIDEVLEKLN